MALVLVKILSITEAQMKWLKHTRGDAAMWEKARRGISGLVQRLHSLQGPKVSVLPLRHPYMAHDGC